MNWMETNERMEQVRLACPECGGAMWRWVEVLTDTVLDLDTGQWYDEGTVALVGYKCPDCSYGWRVDGIIEVVPRAH